MTREDAATLLPIIKAYSEGKIVQFKEGEDWVDIDRLFLANFQRKAPTAYRIKLTPTYRPFANAEECWNEMLKHQPVGWVKHDGIRECITCVRNGDGDCISFSGVDFDLEYLFKNATFEDGSVFGVKEENELSMTREELDNMPLILERVYNGYCVSYKFDSGKAPMMIYSKKHLIQLREAIDLLLKWEE